ncbi:MAG: outer membrane beta-barrel protein [Candidatus Aceula meridiana]|nr:outer membrane beta-barrel protein [Candidatus Aceula meridiana]
MKKNLLAIVTISFLIVGLMITGVLAQISDDKQDEVSQIEGLMEEDFWADPSYDIKHSAAFSVGYDDNVNLTKKKKSDVFENFIYSLDYTFAINDKLDFTLDYDLDYMNYGQFTDNNNLMNHINIGLVKEISRVDLGASYDFSYYHYPHNKDGDFYFHKGKFYIRDYFAEGLYHQLSIIPGLKRHVNRKALANSITTFQDTERSDDRQTYEYTIGAVVNPKIFLKFTGSLIVNESNAEYENFYDYKAYQLAPSIYYKLSKRLQLFFNYMYRYKMFRNRTVTYDNYKQRDRLYAASFGLNFHLTKNSSLSASYAFRNNSSNDDEESYNGNVINVGYRVRF